MEQLQIVLNAQAIEFSLKVFASNAAVSQECSIQSSQVNAMRFVETVLTMVNINVMMEM